VSAEKWDWLRPADPAKYDDAFVLSRFFITLSAASRKQRPLLKINVVFLLDIDIAAATQSGCIQRSAD
jgi:hypothetical protein